MEPRLGESHSPISHEGGAYMICPDISCESLGWDAFVARLSSFPAYGFRSLFADLDYGTA
jgi:hypothetical protein